MHTPKHTHTLTGTLVYGGDRMARVQVWGSVCILTRVITQSGVPCICVRSALWSSPWGSLRKSTPYLKRMSLSHQPRFFRVGTR